MTEQVKFATINENGGLTEVRFIRHSDIAACPHTILLPDHYRADGSCRCDDSGHGEMAEWGYSWNAEKECWE